MFAAPLRRAPGGGVAKALREGPAPANIPPANRPCAAASEASTQMQTFRLETRDHAALSCENPAARKATKP